MLLFILIYIEEPLFVQYKRIYMYLLHVRMTNKNFYLKKFKINLFLFILSYQRYNANLNDIFYQNNLSSFLKLHLHGYQYVQEIFEPLL